MGACDMLLLDQLCRAGGIVASAAGGQVVGGIGGWIADSLGDLAESAATLAAEGVDSTTRVDLSAGWVRENYAVLLPIALVLTVGTFCLQLVHAAWRRDDRALVQAVTGTVSGVLFAFGAISCTAVTLTVVDALSAGLFQVGGTSVDHAVRRVIKVDGLGAMNPLGWAVTAVVALGCAIGAFLYWGAMVFRKVAMLIMVSLAPFAGSAGGWDAAKRWRRGWIEATATLAVSKLVMAIVFLVGISAMGESDSRDGIAALSDALAGLVVMVLVLLCPVGTYKFVRWAAAETSGDDLHRAGSAGFTTVSNTARTAATYALQARSSGIPPQGPPSPMPWQDSPDSTPLPPVDPPATTFRFGENSDTPGNKGRLLMQRAPADGDQGHPLLRRDHRVWTRPPPDAGGTPPSGPPAHGPEHF